VLPAGNRLIHINAAAAPESDDLAVNTIEGRRLNDLRTPEWRLERHGGDAVLKLSGDWIARETGVRDASAAHKVFSDAGPAARVRIATDRLGRWDSALVAFVE